MYHHTPYNHAPSKLRGICQMTIRSVRFTIGISQKTIMDVLHPTTTPFKWSSSGEAQSTDGGVVVVVVSSFRMKTSKCVSIWLRLHPVVVAFLIIKKHIGVSLFVSSMKLLKHNNNPLHGVTGKNVTKPWSVLVCSLLVFHLCARVEMSRLYVQTDRQDSGSFVA
jgi:hypothetical protein